RESVVERLDTVGCIGKVGLRLPRPTRAGPILPMNQVLQLAMANAGVQDGFDLELLVAVNDDWRCWILNTVRDVIDAYPLEEGHMKDGVNPHRLGQLKTESGSA